MMGKTMTWMAGWIVRIQIVKHPNFALNGWRMEIVAMVKTMTAMGWWTAKTVIVTKPKVVRNR